MRLIVFLFMLLFSFSSYADYHIATYQNTSIDYGKVSRVFVIGNGSELGLRFHKVAKAKAMRLRENFPKDQIIVIAHKSHRFDSAASLNSLGFNVVKTDKSGFTAKHLLNELSYIYKIKSLDFFTHSSSKVGLYLESYYDPISSESKNLSKITGKFTSDAYVHFHGCNTGFNQAPEFSRIWNVPVFGSLTSSDFHVLNDDGEFYRELNGFQPDKNWAKENTLSFDEVSSCKNGSCERMRPDNSPYRGAWGSYDGGGLHFYKIFCGNVSSERCSKAMAHSVLSQLTNVNLKQDSSLEEYKKAVSDLLCPTAAKTEVKANCVANFEKALEEGDYHYTPFKGNQLNCSNRSCEFKLECKRRKCTVVTNYQKAETTMREYENYLNAFQYLSELK